MSDNTVLVKYLGSAPWFESSVTGRQTKWLPGHSDYVSAAISQQLAATGLFEVGAAVPVMAQTNQLTGGIEFSAGESVFKPIGPDSGTAVIVGDSTVAVGSNTVNKPSNARSIVQHAMRKLGRPYRVLAETGYSGQTTEQIFAKWDECVTPYNPAVVFWLSGTNDLANGVTPEHVVAQLVVVKNRAISEGRRFVYVGFPQIGGADGAKLQHLIRQVSRADTTFEYTGGSEKLLNFNGTPEQIAAQTLLTNAQPDGTHQSAYGANLWSNSVVNYEKARGYKLPPMFSSVGGPGGNTIGSGDTKINATYNGLVGASGAGWTTTISPASSRNPTVTIVNTGASGLQPLLPGRLHRTVWSPGVSPAASDQMQVVNRWDIDGGAVVLAGRSFSGKIYAKVTTAGGNIHGVWLLTRFYTWAWGVIAEASDGLRFDLSDTVTWSLNSPEYEGVFETTPIQLPGTWVDPTKVRTTNTLYVCADAGATVTVEAGCSEINEIVF